MKWFNKKFKKLTLFDKIIIVVAVLGLAFFAFVFFRKSVFVTIVVKVGEENILYEPWAVSTGTRAWFSQLFHEGMKEQDGLGREMAEVLSIRSYDTLPSRKAVYLTTKLRAVYNRASNQYTFKGRPLLIGSPVRLNLDRLFVDGLITHVEGIKDPRERIELIVEARLIEETPVFPETRGVRAYLAEAIKVGEEFNDDQGNTIAKVLDKKVEGAKRAVVTGDGRVVVRTNPLRKDVYITLQVDALEIGNRYYLFDDVPLLIGNGIPLNTSTISVWPEVTKITVSE